MAKFYGIYHCYDVDGGFGDAVGVRDLLFISESESDAKAYAEKWSNEHVYDVPYAKLYCGALEVEELPSEIITKKSLETPPWKLVSGYSFGWGNSAEEAFNPELREFEDDEA